MRFSWRQNHSRSSDIQGVELVSTVCSQLSCICGYRCHLVLNCSSALCMELSASFLLEMRLVTLKMWFRTNLVELFGPCKKRRTASFCPVPGLSWMMMKEVYVYGLVGFEPCTCYFPNLFLGSEWRHLPTLRTSWSCNTGFYRMSWLDSFNLIRWHSNRYWKTPLACSAFLNFWGCQDEGCGLEHSGVLHVVAGSSLYYTMLCQGILPLACSAISGDARLKVVDWKVLSNIQEFISNTIPTHLRALHVAPALSCLQFVLALRNW